MQVAIKTQSGSTDFNSRLCFALFGEDLSFEFVNLFQPYSLDEAFEDLLDPSIEIIHGKAVYTFENGGVRPVTVTTAVDDPIMEWVWTGDAVREWDDLCSVLKIARIAEAHNWSVTVSA
jgi:hypothetical protein